MTLQNGGPESAHLDSGSFDELVGVLGSDGFAEAADEFFAEVRTCLDLIAHAAVSGDTVQIGSAAHKIKGAAGTLGFLRLSALAHALEASARTAVPADCRAFARHFEEAMTEARRQLSFALDSVPAAA